MICEECMYHKNDEITTTYTDPKGISGTITEITRVGYCFLEPVLVPRECKSPVCRHIEVGQ